MSENEKAEGLSAAPLLLVRLQRKTASSYHLVSQGNPATQTSLECTEPCKFMKIGSYSYGGYREQLVPIEPTSVLAAIVEDARNGYLDSGLPAPPRAPTPEEVAAASEAARHAQLARERYLECHPESNQISTAKYFECARARRLAASAPR